MLALSDAGGFLGAPTDVGSRMLIRATPANPVSNAPRQALEIGDVIIVKKTMSVVPTQGAPSRVLIQGLEGTIKRVDKAGDIMIHFDGIDGITWILKKDFCNLEVKQAMGSDLLPPSLRTAFGGARSEQEDMLGAYVITHENTAVTGAVSTASETFANLPCGTEVNVLEVIKVPEQNRMRARIEHPEGWISLVDIGTDYRRAERKAHAQIQAQVPADIKAGDLVASQNECASGSCKVAIGDVGVVQRQIKNTNLLVVDFPSAKGFVLEPSQLKKQAVPDSTPVGGDSATHPDFLQAKATYKELLPAGDCGIAVGTVTHEHSIEAEGPLPVQTCEPPPLPPPSHDPPIEVAVKLTWITDGGDRTVYATKRPLGVNFDKGHMPMTVMSLNPDSHAVELGILRDWTLKSVDDVDVSGAQSFDDGFSILIRAMQQIAM
jgi:hypothetical protein